MESLTCGPWPIPMGGYVPVWRGKEEEAKKDDCHILSLFLERYRVGAVDRILNMGVHFFVVQHLGRA